MPIHLQEQLYAPGEWGLFNITESEAALQDGVELSPTESEQLNLIRGSGQRREFLAARLLLHQMSGRRHRAELVKDDCGKPHLADSHFYVSISHTANYAAAIANPNPCGIDVQRIVEKIARIAPKFISGAERIQLKEADKLIQMHLIWSAKEAMYKAFGRREIDFKEHLYVDFQDFSLRKHSAVAMLRKGEIDMLFDLEYRIFDDIVLVACVERRPAPSEVSRARG